MALWKLTTRWHLRQVEQTTLGPWLSLVPDLAVGRRYPGGTIFRAWQFAPRHFIPKRVRRLQNLQLQVRCEIRVAGRLVPIHGNDPSVELGAPQFLAPLSGPVLGRTDGVPHYPVHGSSVHGGILPFSDVRTTDFRMIFGR